MQVSDGDCKKDSEPTKKKVSGRSIRCVVKHVVDKDKDKGLPGGEREVVTTPENVVVKTTHIVRSLLVTPHAYMAGVKELSQDGNPYL